MNKSEVKWIWTGLIRWIQDNWWSSHIITCKQTLQRLYNGDEDRLFMLVWFVTWQDYFRVCVCDYLLTVCLAENGRLKNIRGVMNSFNRLMSAHRGEVVCVVTTAKVLQHRHSIALITQAQWGGGTFSPLTAPWGIDALPMLPPGRPYSRIG